MCLYLFIDMFLRELLLSAVQSYISPQFLGRSISTDYILTYALIDYIHFAQMPR